MINNTTDPKDKPPRKQGEESHEEKREKPEREQNSAEDEEEFPDIYNDKDEDFDDPDEKEFI